MKKITLLVMLSAFVAPPAWASNVGIFGGLVVLDQLYMLGLPGKYYVAGDLGTVSYNHAIGSDGTSSFPNPRILRIAGGYLTDRMTNDSVSIAGEWSYSMFSDSIIDYGAQGKDTLRVGSWQAAFVLAYPLNPRFDLTGKIGFINNKVKSSTTVASMTGVNGSNNNLLFGVGAQYHLNMHYIVRAQLESFGKLEREGSQAEAAAYPFSVGLVYEF